MKNFLYLVVLIGLLFQSCNHAKEDVVKVNDHVLLYLKNFDRLNQLPCSSRGLQYVQSIWDGKETRVLVAAHRGDHMEMPENSIPSFEHAILWGTDIIELDIRNSVDDSLMVIHDRKVDRTTNGIGDVKDMTYKAIRDLSLINEFTRKPTEFKVPTLYESLLPLKGKVMIDLDIKCNKIEQIYNEVAKLDMFDQCIFFCDEKDMDYVLDKNPNALVMPRANSMEKLFYLMNKYNPLIIHIDDKNFEVKEAAAFIKSYNPKCRVWANALGKHDRAAITGDDSGIIGLMENGIDVVQTDIPRYVQYLISRK